MYWLILLPFFVQAVVIGIDEIHFHLKRGLPRWERIGHPIDTASVLTCFLFALFVPYSSFALKIYITLAILSCLLVTKDEFVHKHHCPASEQWLHAILFLNHPVMLSCLGIIWAQVNWIKHPLYIDTFIVGQTALTAFFLLYQIIYWNFIWQEKPSTMPSMKA